VKKPLPQAAKIALVGAGGLVVVALGWLVLLGPQQRRISSLQQQTASARAQIADDLARAAEARSGTSAPTIRVADFYKLTTAMPSIVDMPDLLLQLDQTAQAAGAHLQSLSFGQTTVSSDQTYTSLPVTLIATGSFYSITDLVYRLRNLVYVRDGALEADGRIFSVGSIALNPTAGARQEQAAITVNTYVYGTTAAVGGAQPGSSPTTTTATTTTTTTTTTPSSSGPSAAGGTTG
jgi:Tfp pilus assembly protein PilO